MKITLNGEPYEGNSLSTVALLLEVLGIQGGRVAVMVNDAIVKKARFADSRIEEGDSVEVIQMVGGG